MMAFSKKYPGRQALHADGIRAQSARTSSMRSWWAVRYKSALEGMRLGARLGRGRAYAQSGQVESLEISRSSVEATVQGSREKPYSVKMEFSALRGKGLESVRSALLHEPMLVARLFSDDMPSALEDIFRKGGVRLFPAFGGKALSGDGYDVKMSCSCPDWQKPCKHIAAVLWILGEEIASRPLLLPALRGIDVRELVPEEKTRAPLFSLSGPVSEDDDAAVPDVSGTSPLSLLNRLGPVPFWRGSSRCVAELAKIYQKAKPFAVQALNGESIDLRPDGERTVVTGGNMKLKDKVSAIAFSLIAALGVLFLPVRAHAAAELCSEPEAFPAFGVMMKIPDRAGDVPALTPEARTMTRSGVKGGSSFRETFEVYDVNVLWKLAQRLAVWSDRHGNKFHLAKLHSLPPEAMHGGYDTRERFEKAIREKSLAGRASERSIRNWFSNYFGLDGGGLVFTTARDKPGAVVSAVYVSSGDGTLAGVMFRFAPAVSFYREWLFAGYVFAEKTPRDEIALLQKELLRSISPLRKAGNRSVEEQNLLAGEDSAKSVKGGKFRQDERRIQMKRAIAGSKRWWFAESDGYIFVSDMDRSDGRSFMSTVLRMMEAMRKAYARYVPGSGKLETGVVRIFKNDEDYRAYLGDSGSEFADKSSGLWSPGRKELLVMSRGDRKTTLSTMRHEAFHQYLHFADPYRHSLWFNEGHACLFENVKFNRADDSIRVVDEGGRAMAVERNPEKYAALIPSVVKMNRSEFYSGDMGDHYVAAWALCYFLRKAAPCREEFKAYRAVIPRYYKELAAGASPEAASATAWSLVEKRDFTSDFIYFWTKCRNAARAFEP